MTIVYARVSWLIAASEGTFSSFCLSMAPGMWVLGIPQSSALSLAIEVSGCDSSRPINRDSTSTSRKSSACAEMPACSTLLSGSGAWCTSCCCHLMPMALIFYSQFLSPTSCISSVKCRSIRLDPSFSRSPRE